MRWKHLTTPCTFKKYIMHNNNCRRLPRFPRAGSRDPSSLTRYTEPLRLGIHFLDLGQNTVGQWSERRAQTHPRDNSVSIPPLFVSTSSLYRREYGEFTGNDILENGRRSEWETGDQGIDSSAETIEGQGSDNSGVPFGPHRLSKTPHDLYTRHTTTGEGVGIPRTCPGIPVQNHIHYTSSRHSYFTST